MRIQLFMYETLDAWTKSRMSKDSNGTAAGSLIGMHCYGSMNPWTMTLISRRAPCAKYGQTRRHGWTRCTLENWETRWIDDNTLVYHLEDTEMYKIILKKQRDYMKQQGLRDLGGVDINTLERRGRPMAEKKYQSASGFEIAIPLAEQKTFGPTQAYQVPRETATAYIDKRKWKCL